MQNIPNISVVINVKTYTVIMIYQNHYSSMKPLPNQSVLKCGNFNQKWMVSSR